MICGMEWRKKEMEMGEENSRVTGKKQAALLAPCCIANVTLGYSAGTPEFAEPSRWDSQPNGKRAAVS